MEALKQHVQHDPKEDQWREKILMPAKEDQQAYLLY
jgi:hypothetical protein